MVKFSKEKMLVSLIIVTLVALVIGNVASLATEPTGDGENNTAGGTLSLSSNNTANAVSAVAGENKTNNSVNNTNTANNTNTNSNTNRNTNTNTNSNTKANTSNTNSSKLPYAGSNSTVIFVVIALGVSALYAYKKVSDYNV